MLAEDLKALNDSRKEMTERGIKEAAEHDRNYLAERGQSICDLSAGLS